VFLADLGEGQILQPDSGRSRYPHKFFSFFEWGGTQPLQRDLGKETSKQLDSNGIKRHKLDCPCPKPFEFVENKFVTL
jgi:hypothetical protein